MLSLTLNLISLLIPFWTLGYTTGSSATILFAGDAMCHQAQLESAGSRRSGYSFKGYYDAIKPVISSADYAVVNLETPVASGFGYSGYPCFNAPDSFAEELRDAGFDLFLSANNHTLDRRVSGARRTIALLDSLGISHIGTYSSETHRDALIPFIKDINGFKVGFLNYTYGTNGFTPSGGFLVDYINREKMAADVAATRAAGAELIAAAIHWGTEYTLSPDKNQKSLAEYLRNLGVEMIIGGHPHVVQPMIFEDGKLTVYSLGNFVSNMKTADTRGGALLRVTLGRDSAGKAIVSDAAYSLVFVEQPYLNGSFRVVPCEKVVAEPHKSRCRAFLGSSGKMLRKNNAGVDYSPLDSLIPPAGFVGFTLPLFAPLTENN